MISNSGPGVLGGLMTEGGGVGDTRSSRHSFRALGRGNGVEDAVVVMPCAGWRSICATD